MLGLRKLLAAALVLLSLASFPAAAQTLPVQVSVSGDTATAIIGSPSNPWADVTLTFDGVSGLTASSLGLSAQLLTAQDGAVLARLPDVQLNQVDPAFPLLITIEPPALGGLQFRTVRVDVHTHALTYAPGSSYRLFKAPLNGAFTDITDEIAQGSVRARGTTGGFSQFLVLTDLRPTGNVIAEKVAALRTRVDTLAANEQPAFDALLDQVESRVAAGNYAGAIAAADQIRSRATLRSGAPLTERWRSARDLDNQAGDLIAKSASLRYSLAYLRDFGQ